MRRRMNRSLELCLPVAVFENVNHSPVTAADKEVFAIPAKSNSVEDLRKWNELALATRIKRHDINAFLIVPGADRDHCLSIGRDHHFQGHIADARLCARWR